MVEGVSHQTWTKSRAASRQRNSAGHPSVPTPLQQGDRDGLCGLYSIINTVRLLCPELKKVDVDDLVFNLAEVMTERFLTPMELISWGLEIDSIRTLLRAAQDHVETVFDIQLKSHTPQLRKHRPTIVDLWTRLDDKVGIGHVAIIGLSGRYNHWTVVQRVTPKTLTLFDSDGMKSIRRNRCSLRGNRVPHRISLEDVILVRRVNGDQTSPRTPRRRSV